MTAVMLEGEDTNLVGQRAEVDGVWKLLNKVAANIGVQNTPMLRTLPDGADA